MSFFRLEMTPALSLLDGEPWASVWGAPSSKSRAGSRAAGGNAVPWLAQWCLYLEPSCHHQELLLLLLLLFLCLHIHIHVICCKCTSLFPVVAGLSAITVIWKQMRICTVASVSGIMRLLCIYSCGNESFTWNSLTLRAKQTPEKA